MSILEEFAEALTSGRIEVVDLTAPLSADTPVIQLPPPFGQTATFRLEEISRYDERGPAWYWNNVRTGEHTGTHFDAPIHWITGGTARTSPRCPRASWSAPPPSSTSPSRSRPTRTSCSRWTTSASGRRPTARCPTGGWLLYRTGWDARSDVAGGLPQRRRDGPHTPGISPECARWLAEEAPVIGLGVETVGTDAGRGALLRPAVPVPRGAARRRQVRADPAAEPRPAAAHRRGAGRRRRCRSSAGPAPRRGCWRSSSGERRASDRRRRGRRRAGAGRHRHRLRGGRLRQLRRHQRDGRGGGPVRGRPARDGRGDDGRRLRPDERGRGGGGQPAPGLRPDQRADRDHRGGEEPHAARRRQPPRRPSRGRTSSSTSRLSPRPSVRCPMRVDSAEEAPRQAAEAVATAVQQRRTVLLNLPLDVQALPAATRSRPPRWSGRCRRRRRRPTPRTSSGSSTALAPRAGRCSSPGAARAGRGAARRWSSSPTAAARCSPPPPSPRGCSPATRGRWTSPADSPRRWPPS